MSTPLSAKHQQARRGVFASTTLTPFNSSPSFSAHAKKSSISIQHSENPSLHGLGSASVSASGAGVAAAGLVSLSHGSPGLSVDSCYENAAQTLGEEDGAMRNGEAMQPQTSIDSTTVEITNAATRPRAKRHFFNSSASKILGSRKASISSHNTSLQQLEVRPMHRICTTLACVRILDCWGGRPTTRLTHACTF